MTDNEKLIEEAVTAFNRGWLTAHDKGDRTTRTRTGIEAALAVFEKAHTPTDDEREALIEASRRLSEGLDPDLRGGWTVLPDDLLADFRAVMTVTRRWKAEPFVPDWDVDAAARRVKAREDARLGEPSDAKVEAAARALFEEPGHDPESPDFMSWDDVVAEDRERADIWREDARRVLRAAGGVR